MGKADLHMHTTASDGKYSPSYVVELAAKNKLDTIAITDHDTFEGVPEAMSKAKVLGIECITGAEFTIKFNAREIHVLAYGFDIESADIKSLVAQHGQARLLRASQIVDKLRQKGFDLNMDEVKAESTSNSVYNIGRPHIARVMVQKGITASHNEAFIRYLNDDALAQEGISTNYKDAKEAFDRIKMAGGVVVLAHPSRFYSEDEIEQLIDIGLDGIEYLHPSHKYDQQCYYEKLCARHQLLKTGGSDFHGFGNDIQNLGIIAVSNKTVDNLKSMINNRKLMNGA